MTKEFQEFLAAHDEVLRGEYNRAIQEIGAEEVEKEGLTFEEFAFEVFSEMPGEEKPFQFVLPEEVKELV